jgi:dihydrofolate reductase
MGKIVISTNVSLDGVVQDPDGNEGFRLGGWFGQFGGKDLEEWAKVELAEALGTEALLLGRRSDEWFATQWASRTGEWADRLNSLPKYVVSSTLQEPRWNNSTVLRGDVVSEVSKLKQERNGDIVVYASYQLGRTLIEHDLVDELRLVVYPVVLGAGERLFGETSDKKPMRLVAIKTIGDGLAFLTYKVVRDTVRPRRSAGVLTVSRRPVAGRSPQAPGADLVAAGRLQGRRVDVHAERGRARDVDQFVHLAAAQRPGHALGNAPDLGHEPAQQRDPFLQLAPRDHHDAGRAAVVVPASALPGQPRLQPHVMVGHAVQPGVPARRGIHVHEVVPFVQPVVQPGGDSSGDQLHPEAAERCHEADSSTRPGLHQVSVSLKST